MTNKAVARPYELFSRPMIVVFQTFVYFCVELVLSPSTLYQISNIYKYEKVIFPFHVARLCADYGMR